MKILLASSSSGSRGGGELFLVYLGRALAQRGHQVTLWASQHPRMDELANSFAGFGEVVRSNYENTYDRSARSLSSYLNVVGAWKIAREWRKHGADVIHLNKQNLEDGLDLLQAATRSGLPSLTTIHLTQTARYLKAKAAGLRDRLSHRALTAYQGMLVAVLESRWKDLYEFLGPSPRVRFVPNGVPLFDFSLRDSSRAARRQDLGFVQDHTVFLGLGRMMPQKRPLLFLQQAERIYQRLTHARFLWVGDGPLAAEWDAWVRERGMESIIRRLPWQHDVRSLLFAADIFMHTAEYEGLPLAILEAMSAGLPLALSSNLPEEMPFLTQTEPLLLNGEPPSLEVMQNRDDLQRRGTIGRNMVRDQFSFQKMAEGYETLYKTLVASRKGAAPAQDR